MMNNGVSDNNQNKRMHDIQKEWGKMSDESMTQMLGNPDQLSGTIHLQQPMHHEKNPPKISYWQRLWMRVTGRICR